MEPDYISSNFAGSTRDSAIIFNIGDQDSSNFLSSDIHPSNIYSSPSNTNVPGRAKNNFTIILEQFNIVSSSKKPKKEFLNVYIIRAIKRAFRSISKGKIPAKTCIAVNINDNVEMNIWEELQKIYRSNPDFISEKMKPENGPPTGPKSNRKVREDGCKSFNNAFCKEFFSNELMTKSFFWIIDLLYCHFSPQRCCERFKFYCCSGRPNAIHDDICEVKWLKLKDYFSIDYLKDLDVDINQNSQIINYEDLQTDLNLDNFS